MKTVETANVEPSIDVDALRSVLEEFPVSLAILFGSRADGRARSASDVDVAVEFDDLRPTDPDYNDVFLGLSAALSRTFRTDEVDLVDVQDAAPPLLDSILGRGVLVLGDPNRAEELRNQRLDAGSKREPRARFDAALSRIDAHLDADDRGGPSASESESNG